MVSVSLNLNFFSDTSPVATSTLEYQPFDGLTTWPDNRATSNKPDHLLIPPAKETLIGILDFSLTYLDFSTLMIKL